MAQFGWGRWVGLVGYGRKKSPLPDPPPEKGEGTGPLSLKGEGWGEGVFTAKTPNYRPAR